MAAVVGFLVISFAIWGIGDIFRGFGRSTVAKIGRTEITVEQFRNLYNDRLQQYSRQAGRPIGPEQARQLGLDRVLVGQIVSEILLDERARALGLSLSDAEVAKQITTDPAFQGLNGQFDRARFEHAFLYMPFEHAEDPSMQQRSIELFAQLAQETADASLLEWAEKHAAVIRRFGRFPHRNAILGRASTPEEIAFLSEQGSRF